MNKIISCLTFITSVFTGVSIVGCKEVDKNRRINIADIHEENINTPKGEKINEVDESFSLALRKSLDVSNENDTKNLSIFGMKNGLTGNEKTEKEIRIGGGLEKYTQNSISALKSSKNKNRGISRVNRPTSHSNYKQHCQKEIKSIDEVKKNKEKKPLKGGVISISFPNNKANILFKGKIDRNLTLIPTYCNDGSRSRYIFLKAKWVEKLFLR